ncbi:MAG: transketolase [Deltaproteobacteria bacterium]|nr:MAG: transketolase [Deltaproteobacteria bacterium]
MEENMKNTELLAINTIRTLAVDSVQNADSGHPGAPMGMAPAAFVLWAKVMKHNPKNPAWINRDRFILSAGHASSLLYCLIALSQGGLTIDDLKKFRKWGSLTPGHPEFGLTPCVETTTGPLGQGFANGVGMAMAEAHLNAKYPEVINHFTYVMCGDGDLMEGISYEAASLAGHMGLGKLICLYDDNGITIEGNTSISFTEDVVQRFKSQNWHVLSISDGTDIEAIEKAVEEAKKVSEKPSLIKIKTHIAHGSPNLQDSEKAHGSPLGKEEIALTKKNLNWPYEESFYVPEEVRDFFAGLNEKFEDYENEWNLKFQEFNKNNSKKADELINLVTGFLPRDWNEGLKKFTPEDGPIATRKASGIILNEIAKKLSGLIGGSADLAPSNKTEIENEKDFAKGSYDGRNIRFGIREHSMGAIANGLLLHSRLRAYAGTFLVFSDYMRPAIRAASLMKLPVIFVFTHDSIAVGEDGPTHQPVEHIASLRLIPGLTIIRPADANETRAAWESAINNNNGPVCLILSRQGLPVLDNSSIEGSPERGGYVIDNCKGTPDLIMIATGSEVYLCIEAKKELEKRGQNIRVVSLPSREIFEKQGSDYMERIIPSSCKKRLVVEAGIPSGWEKYSGDRGDILGVNSFGASASGATVLRKFGFFKENIVNKAQIVINE